MRFFIAAFALMAMFSTASATTETFSWTSGFASADDRVKTVEQGTTLQLTWSTGHNVYEIATKELFDACDFTGATELCTTSPCDVLINKATTYLACQVDTHCNSGQKLDVTGTAPALASCVVHTYDILITDSCDCSGTTCAKDKYCYAITEGVTETCNDDQLQCEDGPFTEVPVDRSCAYDLTANTWECDAGRYAYMWDGSMRCSNNPLPDCDQTPTTALNKRCACGANVPCDEDGFCYDDTCSVTAKPCVEKRTVALVQSCGYNDGSARTCYTGRWFYNNKCETVAGFEDCGIDLANAATEKCQCNTRYNCEVDQFCVDDEWCRDACEVKTSEKQYGKCACSGNLCEDQYCYSDACHDNPPACVEAVFTQLTESCTYGEENELCYVSDSSSDTKYFFDGDCQFGPKQCPETQINPVDTQCGNAETPIVECAIGKYYYDRLCRDEGVVCTVATTSSIWSDCLCGESKAKCVRGDTEYCYDNACHTDEKVCRTDKVAVDAQCMCGTDKCYANQFCLEGVCEYRLPATIDTTVTPTDNSAGALIVSVVFVFLALLL